MWTIITLAIVALALVAFASRFIQDFRHAEGSAWQRAIYASEDSAVFLWSYLLGWTGTLMAWLASAAAYLNLPEVQKLIEYLPPTWVSVSFVVIAVINVIARIRTLWFG